VPIEVRLPQLAESMTSARLAVWLKREGDVITAGEPIAELETDKTNVELEAPGSGVLQRIVVAAGTESLEVGGLLAVIGEGEAKTAAAPAVLEPPSQPAAPSRPDERIAVTPLARRMALVAGVDLGEIRGSGPAGRVGKVDVERVLRERRGVPSASAAAPVAPRPVPVQPAPAGSDLRPLSQMRRVTAARLTEAKQTIPHFYLQIDCNVDALLEARASIRKADSALKLTLTDCVVRAAALALGKVPLANSAWAETAVRVYGSAHIAVAVETPAGLVTPVIRSAETKGLATISRELKALTDRARAGQLRPEEYTGGTFTISNLGMYGITSLYPILSPPQSCILGVGAAVQRPVVRDGGIAVGTVMSCTLSGDHRAIDGSTGAQLLAEFRRLVEQPWLLMV
jgi:pyruvate dehydrogenase E2 component (dihydrolipoamide acetyltransferase)